MTGCILILTDGQSLGLSLARLVNFVLGQTHEAYCVTYGEGRQLLSRDLLDAADLVLIELFRSYPAGQRAEGIAVADSLLARSIRCLIVSPIGVAHPPDCDAYWEPPCRDSLSQRARRVLESKPVPPGDLLQLKARFEEYLRHPVKHG